MPDAPQSATAGLGPDVAAKVLRASDRNTVAKVAAGDTLPASERARLETSVLTAPTAEELANLKANRQAALIRKWGAGGKLSREEMAEIHTILPPAVLAAPPVVDSVSPSSRLKYSRGYDEIAAEIGVSVRTIKRWAQRGKEVGEIFPFDAMALALDWWDRHMKGNTPSAELTAAVAAAMKKADASAAPATAAAVAGKARAPATGAGSGAGTQSGEGEGKPLIDRADMGAVGIEENLRRLHVIHSANITLLERAFQGSSEADVINRQRNAQRSGEMLAAAQKSFDEYQRARGDVVPIADVKKDLLRIHTAMAQSLLSLVEDLGVPRPRAVGAIDAWFRMLRESVFFASTQPNLAATPAAAPAPAAAAP